MRAGPGLNDNGSGVAAVLAVAERLGRAAGRRGLRFGFWARRSRALRLAPLRRPLSRAERRRIAAYVNLDMVGSPGEKGAVYGARRRGRAIEAALRRSSTTRARSDLGGASDHASFGAPGSPSAASSRAWTGATTGRSGYGMAMWTPRSPRANARATADALVALAAR